ncbi:MAG: hypothetical protein QOI07_902 [Verrucomicrobiota bacterium]|jgi:hypothetical protein
MSEAESGVVDSTAKVKRRCHNRDLSGERYGNWTVLRRGEAAEPRYQEWICRCDCGTERAVKIKLLAGGGSKSCGCRRRVNARSSVVTHGLSATPLYHLWQTMRQRCENPKAEGYARYGGRGIKVCDRWKSFPKFVSDMSPRPEGRSIERIDNNGDYEPLNCRWATRLEQAHNTRSNRKIRINGENLTSAEWSRKLGGFHTLVANRLKLGWNEEAAVRTPILRRCG